MTSPFDARRGKPSRPSSHPADPRAAAARTAHIEKLRLCEALEEIADSLPAAVDRLKCIGVASALLPVLRRAHQYEEEIVFPAYGTAVAASDGRMPTTERLRAEHIEDESFADEVTEALMAIGHGEAIENAEALGFMLRGLFETIRRHVAFESEHILPLIER